VQAEIFTEILNAPALKIALQSAGSAGSGFHASATQDYEIEVNQ
jgi:hypothetical protein